MRFLGFLVIGLVLTGCVNNQPSVDIVAVDPVEETIAGGVSRIADAYEQLALISSATDNDRYLSESYNYDERLLPQAWLQELVLLEDYHGDLGEFVSMLSAMAGLEPPRMDAKGRTTPVIVAVRKGRRKLISYMADVGFQAGDMALVQPDVSLNQIIVSFE